MKGKSLGVIFLLMSMLMFGWEWNGDRNDIMLQTFHWNSADESFDWYNMLKGSADEIGYHFSVVWMPPPNQSPSFAKQGYLPENWYNLNNHYGSWHNLAGAIGEFHANGVKVLADIVINHRNGMYQCRHGRWVHFSDPEMKPWENLIDGDWDTIAEGNEHTCKACATSGHGEGTWEYKGRKYYNDDYNAAPDLTHWNPDTRRKIKNWMAFLRDDVKFDGWRYDYVRGYSPYHMAEYNHHTQPHMAVGEFWKFENEGLPSSHRQALSDIANASDGMVFDFATKRDLNSAFSGWDFRGDWLAKNGANGSHGLMGWWPGRAVTFVDNHDTGWSPSNAQNHWPIPNPCNGDLISNKAAYAYILTHPGIPMVYWADWKDRGSDMKNVIEELIKIRKNNNVHRDSRVWVSKAENGLYAAYIGDENNEQIAIKIGNAGRSNYEGWKPSSKFGMKKVLERHVSGGHAFCVFYKN